MIDRKLANAIIRAARSLALIGWIPTIILDLGNVAYGYLMMIVMLSHLPVGVVCVCVLEVRKSNKLRP